MTPAVTLAAAPLCHIEQRPGSVRYCTVHSHAVASPDAALCSVTAHTVAAIVAAAKEDR